MKNIYITIFIFFGNFIVAQQINDVDFLTCSAKITPFPLQKKIHGFCKYTFKVLKKTDSIYIDAKNMSFTNVCLKGKSIKYKTSKDKLWLFNDFNIGECYDLTFNYKAFPKKAMYFIDWEIKNNPIANPQIWTQGQGKDNSNWIPSFDDMNEKIIFDLSISFNNNFKVVSNGKLISTTIKTDNKEWHYKVLKPMSSYLLAIVIGDYNLNKKVSKSGVALEMYYYPKDSLRLEPTYRYSKKIFDFLENEIGVAYPWQNYKQLPVKDFLYAGMENTGTTIYSDSFVIDSTSFIDKNYVNINAHELAHQWFGNLVTETEGKHHWLQEGFATYYALLAERELFGDDYFYYKLYSTSQQLLKAQLSDTTPLMNSKASSLTFYQKGAWALYALKEQIGSSAFKKSIKKYLQDYKFKNVVTNDFIKTVEKESSVDLSNFVEKWLLSNKFDPINSSKVLKKINKKSIYYKLIQISTSKTISDWSIMNKNIKIRQKLVEKVKYIPENLREDYESLLNDKSYSTLEFTLYNLWINFPKDRKKYLSKTKKIIGFNDKNIKTLWLTLSLNTIGFEDKEYFNFYNELVSYTNPVHHFETRKNAFKYLNELNLINAVVINNLENGMNHHNWRFKSFCEKMYNNIKK
jgi:aminopeptidase N